VQLVSRAVRAFKASWRSLGCWFLDHRWDWYMARGRYGEPGGESCSRCGASRPKYTLPCRCLGKTDEPGIWGCKCEFEGFVGVE
jgi:hypothetical protein